MCTVPCRPVVTHFDVILFFHWLCVEILKYEQEIAELKSVLSKAKKLSRMWKARYEAERRERWQFSVATQSTGVLEFYHVAVCDANQLAVHYIGG